MPLYDAPNAGIDGCNDVRIRRILGVLVDSSLTFAQLLAEVVARGRGLFDKIFFAAETGGVSIPVTAAQVPLRVESAILFAAPFLFLAPKAESTLNRLQVAWGRRLLGCQSGPGLKWSIVTAQCGWCLRLGTRMYERTLMTRARILLLSLAHPTSRLLRLADAVLALLGRSCSRCYG
jgi:hypothetical protein